MSNFWVSSNLVLARGMVKEVEHEVCGTVKLVNTPFKFSDADASIRTPPPTLGQDTVTVLQELGYTHEVIEQLKAARVVG